MQFLLCLLHFLVRKVKQLKFTQELTVKIYKKIYILLMKKWTIEETKIEQ